MSYAIKITMAATSQPAQAGFVIVAEGFSPTAPLDLTAPDASKWRR